MATTWSEQTRDLLQSWTEAQTKLWESWVESTTRFAGVESQAGGELLAAWSRTARQTLSSWSGGEAVAKEVAERLFLGQEGFLRFVDAWMGALRVLAPGMDRGDDWTELLRGFTEQLKDDVSSGAFLRTAEATALAGGDLPQLWSLYLKQAQRLWTPWVEAVEQVPWRLRDAASGDEHVFSSLAGLALDTWESTVGRYLTSPQVGLTKDASEKLLRSFDAWVDFNRALLDFQTELAGAGNRALEKLTRELVERGERDQPVTSFQELFDLWVNISEATYFDLFSSEGFARLQGRALNSYMNYRRRERELREDWLEALDMPTRSEVDQVHKHVYDLRVELRYLKRDLAASRAGLEAARREIGELRAAGEAAASQVPVAGTKAAAKSSQVSKTSAENGGPGTKKRPARAKPAQQEEG